MIEVVKTLPNTEKLTQWLEAVISPQLTPDVSKYARGRLRAWFRLEPPLSPRLPFRQGIYVSDKNWNRLQELIEWPFDYCLATYSGSKDAVGIGPHRDAGYADYEAYGLHVCGECRFDYWCDREAFGYAPTTNKHPQEGPPSHTLLLQPGQVVRFNCKNVHAATPGIKRWNLNFWRKKS